MNFCWHFLASRSGWMTQTIPTQWISSPMWTNRIASLEHPTEENGNEGWRITVVGCLVLLLFFLYVYVLLLFFSVLVLLLLLLLLLPLLMLVVVVVGWFMGSSLDRPTEFFFWRCIHGTGYVYRTWMVDVHGKLVGIYVIPMSMC